MWVMSDRAIPRSLRMMEGFGVHTFRFINEKGKVALCEVSLEAAARRAFGGLGRGAEDLRQGSRLSSARPLGSDRERRLSRSGSSVCRSSKRKTSTIRFRPARSDEDHSGRTCAGAADRQVDAQSQSRTTSLPRPNRSPFTSATSCPASTSPTIR